MINSDVMIIGRALAFGAKQYDDAVKANMQPKDKLWQSGDLAEAYGDRQRKYEHYLQKLVHAGWVQSKRGPRGGYWLTFAGRHATAHLLIMKFGDTRYAGMLDFCRGLGGKTPADLVKAVERLWPADEPAAT